MSRESAEVFQRGTHLALDVFRPDGPGPYPAVVMAHGFGSLRHARLPEFARRFQEHGILVVLFDYRHFGESGGDPRQLLSVRRQLQDWTEVLRYTRSRADVDEARVALWGTSFSGGHVVRLASTDPQVAAVVSQVPMASGPATVRRLPVASAFKMGLAGVADLARSALGGQAVRVPIVGFPGECAAIAQKESLAGYERLHQDLAWDNRVCARIGLRILFYRPVGCARRVRAPLLVQVAAHDTLTPPAPARTMANRAPLGEVRSYPVDHFDLYFDPWFEKAVADQVEFLARHLRPGTLSSWGPSRVHDTGPHQDLEPGDE